MDAVVRSPEPTSLYPNGYEAVLEVLEPTPGSNQIAGRANQLSHQSGHCGRSDEQDYGGGDPGGIHIHDASATVPEPDVPSAVERVSRGVDPSLGGLHRVEPVIALQEQVQVQDVVVADRRSAVPLAQLGGERPGDQSDARSDE